MASYEMPLGTSDLEPTAEPMPILTSSIIMVIQQFPFLPLPLTPCTGQLEEAVASIQGGLTYYLRAEPFIWTGLARLII